MKKSSRSENFKFWLKGGFPIVTITAMILLPWSAAAQDPSAAPTAAKAVPADSPQPGAAPRPADKGSEPGARTPAGLTPEVAGLVKMLNAGVSKEVVKSYIENSPMAWYPSPTDIIALKEQAVPDEIITAMLKRGAGVKATAERRRTNVTTVITLPNRRASPGGLDPESYEYFQHYYLHPRTLESVYQRLGRYYPPYSPYGYPYGYPPRYPGYYGFPR
jgi:hypothetical protein